MSNDNNGITQKSFSLAMLHVMFAFLATSYLNDEISRTLFRFYFLAAMLYYLFRYMQAEYRRA